MFETAAATGAKGLKIWDQNTFHSTSKSSYLTACVSQGTCYRNLAKYDYRNIRGELVGPFSPQLARVFSKRG